MREWILDNWGGLVWITCVFASIMGIIIADRYGNAKPECAKELWKAASSTEVIIFLQENCR